MRSKSPKVLSLKYNENKTEWREFRKRGYNDIENNPNPVVRTSALYGWMESKEGLLSLHCTNAKTIQAPRNYSNNSWHHILTKWLSLPCTIPFFFTCNLIETKMWSKQAQWQRDLVDSIDTCKIDLLKAQRSNKTKLMCIY